MESPSLHNKEPFILNHGSGHEQLKDCQLVKDYSAALRLTLPWLCVVTMVASLGDNLKTQAWF